MLSFASLNHSPLFVTTGGVTPTLSDQAHAAADAGFDALSPDIFSLRACRDASELDQLVATLRERDLDVLDLSALVVPRDAETARANAVEMVQFAMALRPRFVLVKLDCELDAPVAALLREVDEQIAPLGARLGIEPSATSGVRDLDEALALIDEIGRPTMGLVIDSWHFFVGGWSMAALGARTSEAVAFVQLADGWPVESPAELATQTMQHRAVPGDGTFDLAGFLAPWFGDPLEEGPGPGPVPVPVCVEVLSAEWRDRPVAELAAAAMTGVRRLL